LTKKLPSNLNDLKNINHFSPKLNQKYGEKIINAVKEGYGKSGNKRKYKPKPNPNYLRKYDALKRWRKVKGSELSVDSDIIFAKRTFGAISTYNNLQFGECAIRNGKHSLPIQ